MLRNNTVAAGSIGLLVLLVATSVQAQRQSLKTRPPMPSPNPDFQPLDPGEGLGRLENLGKSEAKPLDAKELNEVLKSLKSRDRNVAIGAMTRLQQAKPDNPEKRVSKALEPHIASQDYGLALAASRAMYIWGTKESVPAVLKALAAHDNNNEYLIRTLGRFPDKKTAAVLAGIVTDFDRSHGAQGAAADSLRKYGELAEEPTLAALKKQKGHEHDYIVRVGMVLAEVGGPKSLQALEELGEFKDKSPERERQSTIYQIKQRLAKEGKQ